MKKILCIYSSTLYYGHERSNIEVFLTLSDFDLLILTNSEGISPFAREILDDNYLEHKPILYPAWKDIRKPFRLMGFLKYFYKMVIHNFFFLKIWKQFKPDYIYIANDFNYINLSPSFFLINTPIVYRIGDAPSVHWGVFNKMWRRFISKRTTCFVCISKFIMNLVHDAGRIVTENDKVIYNLPPYRKDSEVNLEYTKQGITFGYLGQIIEIKGVELFLKAAIHICSVFPNVHFILAGDLEYDYSFSSKILNLVEKSGFKERIIFMGSVENIKFFFEICDVLITPSIKEEPLGNVLVEAKKNHTPSIIFNSGGMPELINHKVDGYICNEKSVLALENAMKYYIENQNLIVLHGENAFNSVMDLEIDFNSFRRSWYNVFKVTL